MKVVQGQTAKIPIALRVGEVSETVTVSSQAPGAPGRVSDALMSGAQGLGGTAAPYPTRPGDIFGSRPAFNTEGYNAIVENPFLAVAKEPLSTFSIDVDTASYANVRRFLERRPAAAADAVRIEELINYFATTTRRRPTARPSPSPPRSATCPWNPEHRLALVGLQRRRSINRTGAAAQPGLPDRRLRLDEPPDKLPLREARARSCSSSSCGREDRVAIVVYAGASGLRAAADAGDRQGRRSCDAHRPRSRPAARPTARRGHPARLRDRRASTSSAAASTA